MIMITMKVYLLMWAVGAAVILSRGDDIGTDDADYSYYGSGDVYDSSLWQLYEDDPSFLSPTAANNTSDSSSSTAKLSSLSLVSVLLVLCIFAH